MAAATPPCTAGLDFVAYQDLEMRSDRSKRDVLRSTLPISR